MQSKSHLLYRSLVQVGQSHLIWWDNTTAAAQGRRKVFKGGEALKTTPNHALRPRPNHTQKRELY